MKIKQNLIFFAGILLFSLTANVSAGLLDYKNEDSSHIEVNNRILANVNGKPISVIDVMKKMDMIFFKQFPEYTSSKAARHQFYNINWKQVLQDLIDKELILADAEEAKLNVTSGEVRREMESMFGPNIILNLDKIGMTMEEARNIIKGDIILRRMMLYRVNSKALRKVGPQEIKVAYENYMKANIRSDEWKYRVISIRDKEPSNGATVAKEIEEIVKNNTDSFEGLSQKINGLSLPNSTKVTVSEELKHRDEQISPSYKEVLSGMASGKFSDPIAQKSRDSGTVYRIFYLEDKVNGGVVGFSEVEAALKDKLLSEAIDKETHKYLKKLRKHFAVTESIKETLPQDFQPFTLQ